jgi:hypothetical protein
MNPFKFFHLFYFIGLSILLILGSCGKEPNTQPLSASPLFTLLSAQETGIDFKNQLDDDPLGERNVLSYQNYYHGAGVGIADFNNDGLSDVFFSGNEVPNRLYLNKGNFQFEDISEKAQINTNKHWSTGVTTVDINGDDFLDIYVCQFGPYKANQRKNLFYINNGDLTFTEKAAEIGLDDNNESIQAAFFDYDNDGDLDCYVMNESKYALVVLAEVFKDLEKKENLEAASGNLFRNDGGKFTKITEQAGMLRYGYGLGLAISDINDDGWLDVYVTNDYSVPDFMYINNGDGTFTESLKTYTKQVSFYGMGVDIADINNDALVDIAVVDMAAEDHMRDKTLMASMDIPTFWYYVNNRQYQYQYMFNSLQLNNGNGTFSNIANMGGVSRSDWSWASLLADFDNDGYKDYFVSNGFRRYSRDNDFRKKMERIKQAHGGSVPLDQRKKLYDEMPQIKLENALYRNNKDLTFTRINNEWGMQDESYSSGAAYADLDNDGDLDMVVNNTDMQAFVYRNNASENKLGNYLQVQLKGSSTNQPIIGAKVKIYAGKETQLLEMINTRGYQSAVNDVLHFGLGKASSVDQLEIIWPNGDKQVLNNLSANQSLTVTHAETGQKHAYQQPAKKTIIEKVNPTDLGISFKHKENSFDDFKKEILLPHKQSTLGPCITVGDANGDGFEDFFIGGAAGQSGVLYFQKADGSFIEAPQQPWQIDANSEDMQAMFFDPDGNGQLDLYITSGGGGEFEEVKELLQDRIYINLGQGKFQKAQNVFPEMLTSSSVAKAADYDQDGIIDMFVGGQAIPSRYPYPSRSYLLHGEGRKFSDATATAAPALQAPGIVKDFVWTDLNGDNYPDLVVVGEWMPISFYLNENGIFRNATEEFGTADLKGWWYSIEQADVDNDGDMDFVVGNVGTNTKFHASKKKPFSVFANDFDKNGTCDVVLSKEYKGKLVPARGRQCSSEQMPFIKQKFPTFKEFASADIVDILGKQNIEEALHLQATEFHSLVLINDGNGKFSYKYLPNIAQMSPINGIVIRDLDEDGNMDLIVAGNNYDTEVETPRYDAGNGLIMKGLGDGTFEPQSISKSGFFVPGNVKDIQILNQADGQSKLILVANNNGQIEIFKLTGKMQLSMK